ncbi:DNA-dependent metalloprotease dvc-1 isoform X2 [Bacillus rossius redtenbacheri]
MDKDRDLAVALQLQEKFNSEASFKDVNHNKKLGKENAAKSAATSLVDTTWEYIDPTPDVHGMFQLFNNRFFWGKLSGVEVKWSTRMTSCAGVCCYEGRGGLCSVRLSAPLLKLRPRKDLVETLLHEMIHAYLFVTNNDRDRDGHGPEFHKHMNRINKEAGTKITVYHSFHEEVKFYQQHWWRCNGPCQHRPPFFGTVRRASNRAPGPNDFWWDNHRATCGGSFIKIREPEGFKGKGAAIKEGSSGPTNNVQDIRNFFPSGSASATLKNTHENHSQKSYTATVKKNVVTLKDINKESRETFGKKTCGKKASGTDEKTTGKMGKKMGGMLANKGGGTLVVTGKSKKSEVPIVPSSSKNSFKPFGGEGYVLGSDPMGGKVCAGGRSGAAGCRNGSSTATKRSLTTEVASKGQEKVSLTKKLKNGDSKPSGDIVEIADSPEKNRGGDVQCPVCGNAVGVAEINDHLDGCVESTPDQLSDAVHCPVCCEELQERQLSQHLETCVGSVFSCDDEERDGEVPGRGRDSTKLYPCPCCMTWVEPDLMDHHLDECLSSQLLSEFSNKTTC